jgi:hypothetical protein
VVLSFLLLFLGAMTSLFLKRKLQPEETTIPIDQDFSNESRND